MSKKDKKRQKKTMSISGISLGYCLFSGFPPPQSYIRPATVEVVCTRLYSPEASLQWADTLLILNPGHSAESIEKRLFHRLSLGIAQKSIYLKIFRLKNDQVGIGPLRTF